MSEDNTFNFEKLIVYQKALDSIDHVYDLTEKFPTHEQYRLTGQYRRAVSSIALNIAEGSGGSKREFNNFLRIALRSVNECIVCTTIALRRKYLSSEINKDSRAKFSELAKMLNGLRKSLSDDSKN